MRRREFIVGLGVMAAQPRALYAQMRSRPLVGFLGAGVRANSPVLAPFLQGLNELGYEEGRNLDIEYRFAELHDERLPQLAAELIVLKPSVILAAAIDAAVVARNATRTIPIVSPGLADPVNLGLIASVARPGGNVTGVMPYVDGLPAKQLEIARDIVPGARRVGIIGNMDDPKVRPQRRELEKAAQALHVSISAPEIRTPEDLDGAIARLVKEPVDVVIVLESSMLVNKRREIATLMARERLPALYGYREHVDAGGLVSYGVDINWCSRRAAAFVHKILSGTLPSDLPVEFPTRLQLIVNLKAAKDIGIEIPDLFLLRADEVIE
jgi:putative tryptophan/tyrosine transport system substrate-binding protein